MNHFTMNFQIMHVWKAFAAFFAGFLVISHMHDSHVSSQRGVILKNFSTLLTDKSHAGLFVYFHVLSKIIVVLERFAAFRTFSTLD